MKRVAFVLKVRPEQIDAYKVRRADLWPEMRDALERSGWRNYGLFLGPDGLLFGYWEAEDPCAGLAAHPFETTWNFGTAPPQTGIVTVECLIYPQYRSNSQVNSCCSPAGQPFRIKQVPLCLPKSSSERFT